MRASSATPAVRLREARERLASLYTAWGRPEDAAAWQASPES
jgi:hypothetical protein